MRFYCGCAPGGTADLLCRIPAVVDTKTGAADVITNEAVANGVPDGRAIGLAAMAAMCMSPVMPGQKLPIDVDLAPVANIAGVYNMLVFGKHVPSVDCSTRTNSYALGSISLSFRPRSCWLSGETPWARRGTTIMII